MSGIEIFGIIFFSASEDFSSGIDTLTISQPSFSIEFIYPNVASIS